MADPMTWWAFDKTRRRKPHPRVALHEHHTFGDKAADAVKRTVGSWAFIIGQNVVIAGWMALNVVAWVRHWDPYPFILLNLALSWQAANTGPILQKTANRQDAINQKRDDLEAAEVAEIRALMGETHTLVNQVHQLTLGQNVILDELRAMREEERLAE